MRANSVSEDVTHGSTTCECEMDDFFFYLFPAKQKHTVSKKSREKPNAHCCRDDIKKLVVHRPTSG